MIKKPMSIFQMTVMNAYWVGLSFMWNALHPIVLPAVLLNFVPDAKKNTYLGLLTFVGLVIAMIVQPLSGALSDGWRSSWGRRRPLIVLGTLFDFIFLVILGWAGGLVWLFIGYIGLQVSSNVAHGPTQGLLPDLVPHDQLGAASALKTFMDMFSLIVASLVAGRLLDPQTRNPAVIMGVVIVLLVVFTAITVLGTREQPTSDSLFETSVSLREQWKELRDQFRIDFRANASYWWLIAERGLFLLGIYGIQSFAQYYLQDVLRVPDPPKQTGDLMAALTVGIVILVLVGGWLSDRFGAKRILYIASFVSTGGMLLMLLVHDMHGLTIFGSLLGAGIGLFLTANWTLANALAPSEQAGKFLGFTNLATAGSGALARLEGPALDFLNSAWSGLWVGYTMLFIFGAFCTLLSAIVLVKVKEV
jgi:MFS family permease